MDFFFSLGPIETTFRKYTFHKNRFFYPHRPKITKKWPKMTKKNFGQKILSFCHFAVSEGSPHENGRNSETKSPKMDPKVTKRPKRRGLGPYSKKTKIFGQNFFGHFWPFFGHFLEFDLTLRANNSTLKTARPKKYHIFGILGT